MPTETHAAGIASRGHGGAQIAECVCEAFVGAQFLRIQKKQQICRSGFQRSCRCEAIESPSDEGLVRGARHGVTRQARVIQRHHGVVQFQGRRDARANEAGPVCATACGQRGAQQAHSKIGIGVGRRLRGRLPSGEGFERQRECVIRVGVCGSRGFEVRRHARQAGMMARKVGQQNPTRRPSQRGGVEAIAQRCLRTDFFARQRKTPQRGREHFGDGADLEDGALVGNLTPGTDSASANNLRHRSATDVSHGACAFIFAQSRK